MQKIWLSRIRRDNSPQYKLRPDCFETNLIESFGVKSKARLKGRSIPSIFLFQEQKKERVPSQPRLQK